jgi:hypothetical protein
VCLKQSSINSSSHCKQNCALCWQCVGLTLLNVLPDVICSLQIKSADKEIFQAVRSQSGTQARSR